MGIQTKLVNVVGKAITKPTIKVVAKEARPIVINGRRLVPLSQSTKPVVKYTKAEQWEINKTTHNIKKVSSEISELENNLAHVQYDAPNKFLEEEIQGKIIDKKERLKTLTNELRDFKKDVYGQRLNAFV